jgi:hypothetical protein
VREHVGRVNYSLENWNPGAQRFVRAEGSNVISDRMGEGDDETGGVGERGTYATDDPGTWENLSLL